VVENADSAEETLMALIFSFESSAKISLISVVGVQKNDGLNSYSSLRGAL